MKNQRKTIYVVAALIRRGDEVFATQRGYGDYKDWWEFPGGKVEPGETPRQALVREIREELSADISADGYFTTVEYDYPEFHLSMECYWCSVREGHLTLLEHEAARWLPLENLRQVKWLPADILVIEEIERTAQTLRYYRDNAKTFVAGTAGVSLQDHRARFLKELPACPYILDFGCGSGRDSKAFLELGCRVDASDGSPEMCRQASDLAGIPVKNMLFQELDAIDTYDGIWACASILHLPRKDLAEVLRRISAALKPGGVLYTAFKYGDFEGVRGGRYFTDFTEESVRAFFKENTSLAITDLWLTQDARPGREEERWVNLLAKRA